MKSNGPGGAAKEEASRGQHRERHWDRGSRGGRGKMASVRKKLASMSLSESCTHTETGSRGTGIGAHRCPQTLDDVAPSRSTDGSPIS